MRRPNMKRWCGKFLEAVEKNLPPHECKPSGDDMVAICLSILRPYIVKEYGAVTREDLPVASQMALQLEEEAKDDE